MGAIELVAVSVEEPYALGLAVLLLLGAVWLWWRRASVWPVLALSVLFLLEILYLGDYDWNDAADRLMIVGTLVVCLVGLAAAVAWLRLRAKKPRR